MNRTTSHHSKAGIHHASIEVLESRIAPAVIVVSTLKDITGNAHDSGSLRDAILMANATPGNDTIEFYLPGKTTPLTGTIVLSSDLPQITDGLTIIGGGASKLKIDGGGQHALFTITKTTDTPFDVSLSGLTISRGLAQNGGGLFLNDAGGNLSLTDCVVSKNTAGTSSAGQNVHGGGIDVVAGTATMVRVQLTGNMAKAGDGAVSANKGGDGGGALGGGIYTAAGNSVSLSGCTISGNTASGGAGGKGANGADGAVGSFYSGHGATGYNGGDGQDGGNGGFAAGGGIWSKGNLTIDSSTISGNTVKAGRGGQGGNGGAGGKSGDPYYPGGNGGNAANGGNGASGAGGGIYNGSGSDVSTLAITNHSLISGNAVFSGAAGHGGVAGKGGKGAQNGHAGANGVGGSSANGGGINSSGANAILQDSTVKSNKAVGGESGSASGGGIFSDLYFSISNSVIAGNSATGGKGLNGLNGITGITNTGPDGGDGTSGTHGGSGGTALGGGIRTEGKLVLSNSTVSGNTTAGGSGGNGGNGGKGGASLAFHSYGFSYQGNGGNGGQGGTAGGAGASEGAGIYASNGETDISNSTISGNTASIGKHGRPGSGAAGGSGVHPGSSGYDGGYYLTNGCLGGGVALFLENANFSQVTIAKNKADSGGGVNIDSYMLDATHIFPVADKTHTFSATNCTIASNMGGGISISGIDASCIKLASTIVALNSGAPDVSGAFTADHDLIQNVDGASFSDVNTITGLNPLLGSLAVSKGATVATMVPAKSSPALNVGINPDSLTSDQRGALFARVLGGSIDIGAVEFA